MASNLFGNTMLLLPLTAGITGLDLGSETNVKCALYDSDYTPNYDSTSEAYGVTNEVGDASFGGTGGTGYTAKGDTLTNTAASVASGTFTYDADDAVWTGATWTGVRWAKVFDDAVTAPTADLLIVAYDFSTDRSVSSGTFTVQWNAAGLFTVDYTPN